MHPNKSAERDVEKQYSRQATIDKLERLIASLKAGQAFEIQVAGERLYVPADAQLSIEHEREDGVDELEFQLRWSNRA
jgi:amphi-Trp domain-containing protein